jgi:heme-degrading monooxygenase HmoA
LKPGALQAITEFAQQESGIGINGYIGQYIYQMDRDPDEVFVVVLFKDKTSYFANAESPEQDARFRQMMTYLAAEPEWNDGEVIFADH